jgi:hypothetical protein
MIRWLLEEGESFEFFRITKIILRWLQEDRKTFERLKIPYDYFRIILEGVQDFWRSSETIRLFYVDFRKSARHLKDFRLPTIMIRWLQEVCKTFEGLRTPYDCFTMTSEECKPFESKQSPYDSSRCLQEHRKEFGKTSDILWLFYDDFRKSVRLLNDFRLPTIMIRWLQEEGKPFELLRLLKIILRWLQGDRQDFGKTADFLRLFYDDFRKSARLLKDLRFPTIILG